MCRSIPTSPLSRSLLALLLSASIASLTPGCSWIKSMGKVESDPALPEWSDSMSGARGKNKDAKPSGMLYDPRSKAIEKNLGGDFGG